LNHSYADCDVFVTMPKLKEHVTAGVTIALKNSFGIAPAVYGSAAGAYEPSLVPHGGRQMFHTGLPAAFQERPFRKRSEHAAGRWLPRAAHHLRPRGCPADRSVHCGRDQTMTTGEGPWVEDENSRKIHR
jgi:hypothetical protein